MDDPEPRRLPADRTAPGLPRRHVTAAGVRAGRHAELVDLALLIASEPVTNAVVQGRVPIEVTVRTLSSAVRIEVGDGGAGAPVRPDRKPRGSATSGRGVFLLDQLAGRWGCHPRTPGPGKTVWAELDGHGVELPAGSAAGPTARFALSGVTRATWPAARPPTSETRPAAPDSAARIPGGTATRRCPTRVQCSCNSSQRRCSYGDLHSGTEVRCIARAP